MNLISDFILVLIHLVLLILVAGMIKPWYILWFLEKKNRLKVLKIFGTLLLILILLQLFFTRYTV